MYVQTIGLLLKNPNILNILSNERKNWLDGL